MITVVLVLVMMAFAQTALAATDLQITNAVNDTAAYVYRTVKSPQVGSIGGEWAVLGLARSGYEIPQSYYDAYYKTVEQYVENCSGVLHERKYTEYSRVILALTAMGKDPANVGGYNLLTPLGDFDKTIWQGINGPIFALIALDSGNYPMPINNTAAKQATRDMYVAEILSRQLADGGFALASDTADPDITAMALQALAKYQNKSEVKAAIDKALTCLSAIQDNVGGFASWQNSNSESVVQVIVALNELGIDIEDSRFVKNGYTLADNLLAYYTKGKGFKHTSSGSGNDGMATEQGFYGLVSLDRAANGKSTLYNMTDAADFGGSDSDNPNIGTTDVIKLKPITVPGKTFADISGHPNQHAIEALAERTIINGMNDQEFQPDATMTRSQFAAIMVQALGFDAEPVNVFTDISSSAWYAPYVGTAYTKGIVKGVSANSFNPGGTISREEAVTMVARAAGLCGMDTAMNDMAVRDMLAQFSDYTSCSSWSQGSFAFFYSKNILDQSTLTIEPKAVITRCEIAQMVYDMLKAAELL